MTAKYDQGESQFTLRIGEWRFFPVLNRLERDGENIHLEPKAVAVLEILSRNGEKPVTRQELLDQVWGDTIVNDDALTQVIIKLRKALGDDSRKPSYIQTIPKRGYRLLAQVELDNQPVAPTKNRWYRPLAFSLMVIAGLLIGLFFVYDHSLTEQAGSVEKVDVLPPSGPLTVTVVPFEASGGSVKSKRFALGITLDLSTDLSKLSALRVISYSDSLGKRVFSRYLVTGNIQEVDQHLKLYVSLIDSETRQQIWAERFEKPVSEFFEIQQSISEQIVNELSIKLSTAERQRLGRRYTRNMEAYSNFLSGQAELLRRERQANINARDWYRLAIEHDPAFARAYAGLALSYAADYRNQWIEDGDAALTRAREMSVSAQQIDPAIPEVYWVLGYVNAQYREHEQALQVLQQAIDLDPSYADAYALMAGIHTYMGEPAESVALLRQAMKYRPEAGFLYYLLLGRAYFFLGDYEQAMINLNETVDRNPESLEAHLYIAATALAAGDSDKARWEFHEIESIEPGFDLTHWLDTYPMTDQAQVKLIQEKLNLLGM